MTPAPLRTSAGYPILRSAATRGGHGMLPGSIVLADISAQIEDEPFATWWMNEQGDCTAGRYFSDRASADADFDSRVAHEVKVGRA